MTGFDGLDALLMTLMKAIALYMSILIAGYLKRLAEHMGLQVDEKMQTKIREKAMELIFMTEEKYLTDEEFKVKAHAIASKLYSCYDNIEEKVSTAKVKAGYVVASLLEKFPNVSQEEAEEIVNGLIPTLHEYGIGGVAKKLEEAMEDEE